MCTMTLHRINNDNDKNKVTMKKLTIFENKEFGQIRTCVMNGEPMFCAKDVCDALGYKKVNNAIAQHVDEDDSLKQGVIDRLGRTQQAIFVNESGLYALILSSKLDSAKRFKRWVTGEVLPAIRQQDSNSSAGY